MLHHEKLTAVGYSHTWPLTTPPRSHSSNIEKRPTKHKDEVRRPSRAQAVGEFIPHQPSLPWSLSQDLFVPFLSLLSYPSLPTTQFKALLSPQPGPGLVLSQLPTGVALVSS